jgi:hypothetical protein
MNRLATDYEIDRQPGRRTPERDLWLAVLRLALVDATSSSPAVRASARQFIDSPDLLHLMDLAGIDREMAPTLRAWKPTTAQPRQGGRRAYAVA